MSTAGVGPSAWDLAWSSEGAFFPPCSPLTPSRSPTGGHKEVVAPGWAGGFPQASGSSSGMVTDVAGVSVDQLQLAPTGSNQPRHPWPLESDPPCPCQECNTWGSISEKSDLLG